MTPAAALLSPTTSLSEASARLWPVIVVGAGVAGACAAAALAQAGVEVLLVEKDSHPRGKVCGGCLNGRALASLERFGLRGVLDSLGPQRLLRARIVRPGGKEASFPFPVGEAGPGHIAVSREALDEALVSAAIARGASYLDRTRVVCSRSMTDHRQLSVRGEDGSVATLRARTVLACDGLGSALARSAGLALEAKPCKHDKIGAAFLLEPEAFQSVPGDTITMACGPMGYVGIARVEKGRWNVAAALRPKAVQAIGGVSGTMDYLLASCGLETLPHNLSVAGRPLTCARLDRRTLRPWAERMLLAGDASGYVEPLTGEGMAWALAAAEEAVRIVTDAGDEYWTASTGPSYEKAWRKRVERRRGLIQATRFVMDRPAVSAAALTAVRWVPALGRTIARSLSHDDRPITGIEAVPPSTAEGRARS